MNVMKICSGKSPESTVKTKGYGIMTAMSALALTICLSTGCVKDLSTTGDGYVQNDNTYDPVTVRAALNAQQKKLVNYFFEGADQVSGFAFNSSTDRTTLTTGATGMGIMNLIIGVERGWISREDAAAHVMKIAEFLDKADRYHGSWSHWYTSDGKTAAFGNQTAAGEIVETAFMMAGLLTASEYFTGSSEDESAIRTYTEKFWNEVDWSNFVNGDTLYWIWHSDQEGNAAYELPLVGWNETMIVYILAMAAPQEHRVPQSLWSTCWVGSGYDQGDRTTYGYPLPLGTDEYGGPLFLSQYSFLGLDPRRLSDSHAFYWTQNLGHTMINRHYCIYEAPSEYGYSASAWGLTACGGCGDNPDYKSRDPKNDDGVLAPTAALSAYPYVPFYATQVLLNLQDNWSGLDGQYGFGISYSPGSNSYEASYLGMEHAPMAIMMENYRTGLIWDLLMRNEHVKEGLSLAGMEQNPDFSPGFYLAMPESVSGAYDMMRHPDRGTYEIDFYAAAAGEGTIRLTSLSGENVYENRVEISAGANVLSFFDSSVTRGRAYNLTVTDASGKDYTIKVNLR